MKLFRYIRFDDFVNFVLMSFCNELLNGLYTILLQANFYRVPQKKSVKIMSVDIYRQQTVNKALPTILKPEALCLF